MLKILCCHFTYAAQTVFALLFAVSLPALAGPISTASTSGTCPSFYNLSDTGTSEASVTGPAGCNSRTYGTTVSALSNFLPGTGVLGTMSFSIVSSDIFNSLNASGGFEDFFVASGATGIGIISYTFTPTSTSNVGIIVNSATARLKLSQSGSSLIDTQACSYTLVSFPIFAFPCIAPVTGSAQIVFGTPFELAASFAVNASGLDFGPLAATAKLTYSITAADGTPLPLAGLQVAAAPEPSSLWSILIGVSLLAASRRVLSVLRQTRTDYSRH